MAIKNIRKKLIITIIVGLVLTGAGVGYAFYAGYLKWPDASNNISEDVIDTSSDAYKATLQERDDRVTRLVNSGSQKSIQEADQLVEEDVKKAEQTGDEQYIHDTYIAKATLLINTGRAQQALDEILLPLEKKYENNEEKRHEIYGMISWAYRWLDDQNKANEYSNKMPSQGWN